MPSLVGLGPPVISSDFADHRRRTTPSSSPGVDIFYRRPSRGRRNPPTFSALFTVPPGTPALAWAAGRVVRSEVTRRGVVVEVDHPIEDDPSAALSRTPFDPGVARPRVSLFQVRSVYRHLDSARPTVDVGSIVTPGQVIATLGSDPVQGANGLRHLHWELQIGGQRVDPQSLFDLLEPIEVNVELDLPAAQFAGNVERALNVAINAGRLQDVPATTVSRVLQLGRQLAAPTPAKKKKKPKPKPGGGIVLVIIIGLILAGREGW